jgi:hypothetical protein
MGSAGGAGIVPSATGAVTWAKLGTRAVWTDRKGEEAIRE